MTKGALVTGASRRIGRSIALQLAEDGFSVAANYAGNKEKAETVVKGVKEKGVESFAIQANIAEGDQIKAAIKGIVNQFGSLDVPVDSTDITRDNLLMRMKEQEWGDITNTNLKGTFNCIQKATSQMLHQRGGAIINLPSIVTAMGDPRQANYVATEAGIRGLTKSSARKLTSHGITVSVVAPGFIVPDMTNTLNEDSKSQMLEQVPLSRSEEDKDIAYAVPFLASDHTKYITGQALSVSGGMYM